MKKYICLLLFVSGFLIVHVSGQNDTVDLNYEFADTSKKYLRLFEDDELLKLTLRFDITSFSRKKSKEEYLPGILTCHVSETDSLNKEIQLRARGNMRYSICSFPPIRLNFKKSKSASDEFSNIDKIKMVTHCEPGNQIYALKEYLAYKLYNVLTDYSYRVRLARITYINTNTARKSKPRTEFAFFIEPDEVLFERINGVEVKTMNVTQKNIKPEIMDRMAIFNCMIGNTDWSVPIHHNVVIMSQGDTERPDLGIVVPYDFDYAGLINADYAVPYEGLGLKSVLERRYLGICRSEETFIDAIKEFSDKKEEFIKVINDFPYLNEKSKKEMILYLESFFKDFDKRNTIVYKLRDECIDF
jgi:hypothetical protein